MCPEDVGKMRRGWAKCAEDVGEMCRGCVFGRVAKMQGGVHQPISDIVGSRLEVGLLRTVMSDFLNLAIDSL